MSLKIDQVERTALSQELLALVKQQVRVLSTTDDVYITGLIVRTIDLFERQSGLTVFPTEATWKPDEFDRMTQSGVLVPLQPVSDWTATDSEGTDVTASYEIVGAASGRAGGQYLRPTVWQWPLTYGTTLAVTVALEAGSATMDDIAPGALQAILDRVASLYAFREDVTDGTANELPLSDQVWMVGNWVPRV